MVSVSDFPNRGSCERLCSPHPPTRHPAEPAVPGHPPAQSRENSLQPLGRIDPGVERTLGVERWSLVWFTLPTRAEWTAGRIVAERRFFQENGSEAPKSGQVWRIRPREKTEGGRFSRQKVWYAGQTWSNCVKDPSLLAAGCT